MEARSSFERILEAAVARTAAPDAPSQLARAVHYAVFPGGGRIRPRLCLAAAAACAPPSLAGAETAAVAIELLHCASLVHDDLPCFDDADVRRGKPSVHKAFGEAAAVLTGDALILLAFDVIASAASELGPALPSVLAVVTAGVGMPRGIIAGQAWEAEQDIDLAAYHRAKTGGLFIAAVQAGAAAAGADPSAWFTFGAALGDAYQLADDLLDAGSTVDEIGKPAGQDELHGRPSAVMAFGFDGALERLGALGRRIEDAIPPCPGEAELRAMVSAELRRMSMAGRTRLVA